MPTRIEAKAELRRVACQAVVWFWLLGIVQYGYRYVLQVNDTGTSQSYGTTPAALSAIKYGLLLAFGAHAFFRLCCMRWQIQLPNERLRGLLWLMGAVLLGLAVVIAMRLVDSGGELDRETWVCMAELIPWMTTVFLVPIVVRPEHGVAETLRVFERMSFWAAWPFWAMTVVLAAFDVRYPALSHPGVLLRFGGVLDDPNGYACLCLLWLVLCLRERTGHWKWRSAWYLVMLISTVSLAGYGMAVVMGTCWITGRLLMVRGRPGRALRLRFIAKVGLVSLLMACAAGLLGTIYSTEQAVDILDRMYESKSISAAVHLEQLTPSVDWFEDWRWIEVLSGKGGFSENFYWRVLLNFGLGGLTAVLAAIFVWFYQVFWKVRRWRSSLGAWGAGVLIGSNGIAYLLVFPLNLICWSALALVMCGEGVEGNYKNRKKQHTRVTLREFA
jgi:hypothetical protein